MSNRTKKQHEHLAGIEAKKTFWGDVFKDTQRVWGKVSEYLEGYVKVVKAHDEARAAELNKIDHRPLPTTVLAKVEHALSQGLVPFIDNVLVVDIGNQTAKADIIARDGTVLATAVPVTTLLAMKREFGKVLSILTSAPTNAIGTSWIPAGDGHPPGSYKSEHDGIEKRNENGIQGFVLVAATERHPAQVDKLAVQKAVADIITTKICGTLSSSDKARYSAKAQELCEAVDAAITRANDITVEERKVGAELVKFILG